MKKSLEKGTYKISPYANFKVYEPKERDILSTKFKDRVFQRSYVDNYFYDFFFRVRNNYYNEKIILRRNAL